MQIINLLVYKATPPKAGDKRLIFGRPFTHNGTKWIPDDQKTPVTPTADSKPAKPKPDKKPVKTMSADEATKILTDRGAKGIYALNRDGIQNILTQHGFSPEKMSFEEKSKALMEIVDKIKSGKEEEVKSKTEKPKYGFMSCEGAKVKSNTGQTFTVGFMKDTLKNETEGLTLKGGHWGSAKSTTRYAISFAAVNAHQYRPIDKIENGNLVPLENFVVSREDIKNSLMRRNYAQSRLKTTSREKNPVLYRGMTIDPKAFESILKGESDTIELTGCTAFTFHTKIMDQYSSSSWTQGFGKDKKSIKIVLQRDDDVDNSIGMWHDHKDNSNLPAFEILTGIDAVRIVKIEKPVKKTAQDIINEQHKRKSNLVKQYAPDHEIYNELNDAIKNTGLDSPTVTSLASRMWNAIRAGENPSEIRTMMSISDSTKTQLAEALKATYEKHKNWINKNKINQKKDYADLGEGSWVYQRNKAELQAHDYIKKNPELLEDFHMMSKNIGYPPAHYVENVFSALQGGSSSPTPKDIIQTINNLHIIGQTQNEKEALASFMHTHLDKMPDLLEHISGPDPNNVYSGWEALGNMNVFYSREQMEDDIPILHCVAGRGKKKSASDTDSSEHKQD